MNDLWYLNGKEFKWHHFSAASGRRKVMPNFKTLYLN